MYASSVDMINVVITAAVMSEEQFELFLKFYCDLCARQVPVAELQQQQLPSSSPVVAVDTLVECRHQCAFNFPVS